MDAAPFDTATSMDASMYLSVVVALAVACVPALRGGVKVGNASDLRMVATLALTALAKDRHRC